MRRIGLGFPCTVQCAQPINVAIAAFSCKNMYVSCQVAHIVEGLVWNLTKCGLFLGKQAPGAMYSSPHSRATGIHLNS